MKDENNTNDMDNTLPISYTPGPWTVVLEGYPLYQIREDGGDQMWVATVVDGLNGTSKGNAALLASAPEMFSLCEDLLHQLSTDSDLDEITGAEKYEAFTDRLRVIVSRISE